MRTKNNCSAYIIRGAAWALFVSFGFIAVGVAVNLPNGWHKPAQAAVVYNRATNIAIQPGALTFAERVAYQRAIEDVYWRHRIWPKENPDPKPSLDAVMSQAQLEDKVAGYLRDSLALKDNWQRPITAEQLQAEMDRMARETKQPEVLHELFEALGNDPAIIAECLARPILAKRLIAGFLSHDQIQQIEYAQRDVFLRMSVPTTLDQVVYTLPEIAEAGQSSVH